MTRTLALNPLLGRNLNPNLFCDLIILLPGITLLAQIELRQLAKGFPGGIAALQPFDLTINAGELLVVLGPSGSGKSTLLRLIAGLEVPSAGSVWFNGRDVTRVPPHRRDVAMVFQHPALYPHLSVFDNLAFGLKTRGVSRGQTRTKVNTVAGLLGLDHVLARRPARSQAESGNAWRSAGPWRGNRA